jgi:hypothetical protein
LNKKINISNDDERKIIENIFYVKAETKLIEFLEKCKVKDENSYKNLNIEEYEALDTTLLKLYSNRFDELFYFEKLYDLLKNFNYINFPLTDDLTRILNNDKYIVLKACFYFSKGIIIILFLGIIIIIILFFIII